MKESILTHVKGTTNTWKIEYCGFTGLITLFIGAFSLSILTQTDSTEYYNTELEEKAFKSIQIAQDEFERICNNMLESAYEAKYDL